MAVGLLRDRWRGDERLIEQSGLFDASYYLINGRDVMDAGVEPIAHFCSHGWREGRRPNLFFDPTWYAERHLGGESTATNPLVHYIRRGEASGCRPIAFFDPSWFGAVNRLPKRTSPLRHYLENRRSQTLSPTPLFDVAFYMDRHAGEIGPNRDPFMHHVRHGAALRDLDPSARFDAGRYRRDVMAADSRSWLGLRSHEMRVPLVHYLDGLDAA